MGAVKRLLRETLLVFLSLTLRVIGTAVRGMGSSRDTDEGPRARPEIALFRMDLLGDVVFSLATAAGIKRRLPDARITMIILPQTAPLAAASPDVDAIVALDTNLIRSLKTCFRTSTIRTLRQGLRHLRSTRFEFAISVYGRTASLLALLTTARVRVGYRDDSYPSTLDVALLGGRTRGDHRQHDSQLGAGLAAAALGGDAQEYMAPPRLHVGDRAAREVEALLDTHGIGNQDRLVVLHAGSSYGDFKRWPAEYFVQLAGLLTETGTSVVVAGSAQEAELARTIGERSAAVSLAGETTLPRLIALLHRASLIISGDSGPLHIATALGIPAVAIYGPTDPEINGPRPWQGQEVVVLRRDIACSPCYSVRVRAECPLGHPICMDLVRVQDVYEAAARILATG